MKTSQKFYLFCFFMPLVKLAPPNQQHSTLFHETFQQGYEDALFQEDYEDYPQDGVKNKNRLQPTWKQKIGDKVQKLYFALEAHLILAQQQVMAALKQRILDTELQAEHSTMLAGMLWEIRNMFPTSLEDNTFIVFNENKVQLQRDDDKLAEGTTNYTKLATCLLCVCLIRSIYCEEMDIESIPVLPKETGYLYARFNKIKKVKVSDFAEIPTLRRIDLTGNAIQEIEDGAFAKLVLLEELSLADNRIAKLPLLPPKLISLNVNNNRIKSRGIKANAFKKLTRLSYLYLAQNALESVPPNLPESLRILHLQFNNITSITDETFCKGNNQTRYVRQRMDEIRMEGNPVILGKYPNAFICLKSLPVGQYF